MTFYFFDNRICCGNTSISISRRLNCDKEISRFYLTQIYNYVHLIDTHLKSYDVPKPPVSIKFRKTLLPFFTIIPLDGCHFTINTSNKPNLTPRKYTIYGKTNSTNTTQNPLIATLARIQNKRSHYISSNNSKQMRANETRLTDRRVFRNRLYSLVLCRSKKSFQGRLDEW